MMMRRRIWLSAVLATLVSSLGCTRCWCERHGYYPAPAPAAYQPCVPCCPCGPAPAGYAAPAPAWNAPAAAPAGGYAPCCPPPPHQY